MAVLVSLISVRRACFSVYELSVGRPQSYFKETHLDHPVNVVHERLLAKIDPHMHAIVPLHTDRRVESYTLRSRKILERGAFIRQLDPKISRKRKYQSRCRSS